MRTLTSTCIVGLALLAAVSAQATPILGTYDSRVDPSVIVDPGYWQDTMDLNGLFMAGGGNAQWYFEAYGPLWDPSDYGFIQLNGYDSAPWFGDDLSGVSGYEGQITGWNLNRIFTYDVDGAVTDLDLVFNGTAVLDQYLLPDLTYVDMAPVMVSFEMGFNGLPHIGQGYYDLRVLSGEPTYFTVTLMDANPPIPEPASLSILGLGLAGLAMRSARKRSAAR